MSPLHIKYAVLLYFYSPHRVRGLLFRLYGFCFGVTGKKKDPPVQLCATVPG